MKNPDRLISVLFVLLSLGICLLALKLPGGTIRNPGPMAFPLLLGLCLLGLSLALFLQSKPSFSLSRIFPGGEMRKVAFVLGIFFVSIVTLEGIGFVASITVLLGILFYRTGGRTILRGFSYGLVISIVVYLSFKYLLGVNLPKGILTF